MAQLVHDSPLIRMDTSLPTLSGLGRNGYLLSRTQALESSITSSYTILHSYRLCPFSVLLSMQGSVLWLLGTAVQCGVVRLGVKGCSISMALEIPVASNLGTPRYFAPKPHAIGSHNLWLIISMVLLQNLYRRTIEPYTITKTTTIIGQRLTSEQHQLETNG